MLSRTAQMMRRFGSVGSTAPLAWRLAAQETNGWAAMGSAGARRGLKWRKEKPSAKLARKGIAPPEPTLPLHPLTALETEAPTGWTPPLGPVAELPFSFSRTSSKLLPVYRSYRNGCTRIVTILRKYRGDAHALRREVQAVLGPDAKIELHQGSLHITGDHKGPLTLWLRRLGF
eukprot:TRINITY_DN16710_c0_g1_i1.p2 TRINITY_DN16710_c0_g1~~TRINITY_DN16710_c0_g1_i1.p2  ORF type:complete len:174 (-),score=17.92 TRINITY_DN16710_c0_g1_i1:32-553(-)